MNLKRNWDLKTKRHVFKTLDRMPSKDAVEVLVAIKSLANNPFWGDVKKLRNDDNVWRRRVGAYRIFYNIQQAGRIVLVFKIERRSSATY